MPDNFSSPTASAQSPAPFAIRVEGATKRFPGVIANENVSVNVRTGSFHAIIGENGAGKSTLLNLLYGRFQPDEGRIFFYDTEVTRILRTPADAIRQGLGLVSQHYALIPALTVLENVVLGAEPAHMAGVLNRYEAVEQIAFLSNRLGLGTFDLDARASQLSIAAGQKVEILKALYRGARTLLLDEPTATLAPTEASALFELLRTLQTNGTTIVFVTHKLREVMQYSDAVTVLRAGRNAGDFITAETDAKTLLSHMIGPREPASKKAGSTEIPDRLPAALQLETPLFELNNVIIDRRANGAARSDANSKSNDKNEFKDKHKENDKDTKASNATPGISLTLAAGEIVGIAGVDGSGQRELAQAILGVRPIKSGEMRLAAPSGGSWVSIAGKSVRERRRMGIAGIPEDRHRAGLILDFSIAENYLLGHERDSNWGGGLLLRPGRIFARAQEMIKSYDVRVGERNARALARTLSGGNQQKIVIARALESGARLLIASQPTRGLDVEAAGFIYETLRQAKARGMGILLFSLDLDEIFEMSDRIAVMYQGQVVGILPRAAATPENIGALMTGAGNFAVAAGNSERQAGRPE